MIAERRVEAERLDALAPEDRGAQGSRRDLGRINSVTRHPALMAGLLGPQRFGTILDLGAGDGLMLLKVARRLAHDSPGTRALLLDQHELLPKGYAAEFARLGWSAAPVAADVFDFLTRTQERFDAVVANQFLHHWPSDRLAELLELISRRTRLFVACEPYRSRSALAGSRMLWALGCNGITRHDARASIRAGFRGSELSDLWPSGEWNLHERTVAPFSHVFRAEFMR